MNSDSPVPPNVSGKRARPFLVKGSRKFMREKLQNKHLAIPSLITVVGLFSGFLAIISALKGQFEYATKCIAVSFVLDGLDGRVARRLNATSAFGREFDSLCDLVAFGVAPAVLTYCWAFSATADELGVLVGFLFVAGGATRLARFNVTTTVETKSTFTGLPIPGAAAAITAVVYGYPEAVEHPLVVAAVLGYMTLLALLMVSTFPYLSVKKVKLDQGDPRIKLLLLSVFVAVSWKFSKIVLISGLGIYVLSGIVFYTWKTFLPRSFERSSLPRKIGVA